jgi:hypothetical protein
VSITREAARGEEAGAVETMRKEEQGEGTMRKEEEGIKEARRKLVRRMGVVWKRGQINTAFRRRFFVLSNGILR